MKQKTKLLLLFVCILSMWQMKAQIAPPTTYIALPNNSSSQSNITLTNFEQWFQITTDSVNMSVQIKLQEQGIVYGLSKVELFRDGGAGLIQIEFTDTLRTDSSMWVGTNHLNPPSTIYLRVTSLSKSCSSCLNTKFPIISLYAHALSSGCNTYIQPPCEFIKDGSFEFATLSCAAIPNPNIGACNNNPYTGFANCFWTLPVANTYVNCGSLGSLASLGTSDYYYGCNNTVGANTGIGFSGIHLYSEISLSPTTYAERDYREYITETLNTPLVPLVTYSISMWVKRNPNFSHATSNIQLALSNSIYTQNSFNAIVSPAGQIINMTSSIVASTTWAQLTATFVANSNYSNATIGNFVPVGSSSVSNQNPSQNIATLRSAYYYIDDVSIGAVSAFSVASQSLSLCQNTPHTVTLSVSPPTSGVTYSWSSTPTTSSLSTQTGSAVVVSPTVTTTYTISNALGCANTVTAQVIVTPIFNYSAFYPSQNTVCPSYSFDIIPVQNINNPMLAYNLLPTNMTGSSSGFFGVPTYTTGINTYTVVITDYTDPNAPCVVSQTLSVAVNTLIPSYTIAPTTICAGETVTLTTDANISYASMPLYIDWGDGSGVNNFYTQPQTYNYSTAGTYTIIATGLAGGCQSTYTQAIQLLPAGTTPTITISPSPQALCVGACATYTASGALTYTWSTGVNTPTATLCPTITTSYYVKGENACGLVGIKYITIGVIQPQGSITATANPNPICAGEKTTLQATGATSYTWTGLGQGNNITVIPSVTTTYTVFGSNGCGTQSAVVTVTVLSNVQPTVSISSNVQYPCLGTSLTLTANVTPVGTYTYNWSTPINQTGSVITYTPTENATYICTITDQCGHKASANNCVTVVSNRCCLNSDLILNNSILTGSNFGSNLSGGPCKIFGTITIAGNVNWTNTEFRMQQGAKIVIKPGAKLTLNNCQLYSCADMWEGIILQSGVGSSLTPSIVVNNSSIEDAYKAIQYDAQGDARVNIITTTTTFNKNYIGLSIENTNVNTNTSNSTYGDIFNGVSSINSPGNNLKCSSFYVPTVKTRPYAGVYFKNQIGDIHIGDQTNITTNRNSFNNMDYGIYLNNSGVRSRQNNFTNLTGTNLSSYPAPPNIGIGIYSRQTTTIAPIMEIDITDCLFTNVWRGVDVDNAQFGVYNSTLTCSSTSNYLCSNNCIGDAGIYSTNIKNYGVIALSYFSNFKTGIASLYNVTTAPSYSFGVSQNTITATGAGFCQQAITIQSAINNYTITPTSISIANNKISNVQNGILSVNLKNGLRISNNSISVQFATSGLRYGIRLNGTLKAFVDNNTISSTGATNANLRGIYMQLSPNCKVQCNNISNVGQCVLYEGNNNSLINGFANNAMSNSKDGLVLKSNGVIGQQGFSFGFFNFVSGNTWGSFSNFKTFTDIASGAASTAQNSKLYVAPGTLTTPGPASANSTNGPANARYGVSGVVTPPTLIVNNGSALSCPAALPYAQRVMPFQPIATIGQLLIQDQSLTDLINTSINYGINNIPTQFLQRQYVYNAMKQAQVVTTNSTLTTFFNSNTNTGLGQFAGVDSLIIKLQHAQAAALNTTASTGTPLEQNHQQINTQLLNKLLNANYNYSASDMSTLYGIAGKCPLSDGNAVYQARALLCYIEDRVIEFTDSCDGGKPSGARIGHSDDNGNSYVEEMADNFILYPNPNNGTMQLLYSLNQAKTATLTVYDITGKQVYAKDLDTSTSLVDVSINNLSQGVYYYKIIDANGKVLKSDKLIIIK